MKPRCVGNQYEIQYRCPGISIPIKERFATKEEAEVRIAEVKLAKKRKNLVPPRSYLEKHGMAIPRSSTVNVRSLLENYVRVYGVNNWSDSTLSGHLTRMEHYIFPYMGNRDIRTITALDLDSFYDQLQHTKAVVLAGHPDTGKCVGHTVIEKIHSLLRCAFHQAVKWQMIERNPADYATLPRFKTAKRDVWTPEEAKHAVELCTDPRLKLAMLVAIGCSMKLSLCGDIKAVQGDTGHSQANMVTDVYAHINNKDRQRLAVMVNDSFFEKDEDQEMYEKCTKPDEQNDTKSDSNHSALSPEISTIVDALQQNQGMAAAIMGMIKCMA